MSIFQKLIRIWEDDHLLRRVVKNSSYLFSSNVISSILSFVQTILAVHLIGLTSWGLVAVIQTFASNINRFLSFRMSEVVLKHFGPALADEKNEEAAMTVKAAGLMEAITSLVAFLILVFLAPWASLKFANDVNLSPLFISYGGIVLCNLVFETSTGVLQATHHFRHMALANLVQTIITLVLTAGTYVIYRWGKAVPISSLVFLVLVAYVAGKTYFALSYLIMALRELNNKLGKGWWRVSLRGLPNKRNLLFFAINTNLNGTVNLIFRDNIQLYLAALLSLTAVGYFKIAMTFIIPITLIIDPFIAPTYAEISRTIARFQWKTTLRLLKRITAIASAIVLTYWVAWAAVGRWILPILYKNQAKPVYPVLLILIAGYGFASIFQWNRSLFLSFGKAGYPIFISTLIGVIELALMVYLVPSHGYLMMAIILSGYFIVSIGLITVRGLWEVRRRMLAEPQPPTGDLPQPLSAESQPEASRLDRGPVLKRVTYLGVNRWDWIILSTFLAFAVVYFLGRLQGNYPVVILSGDGGNIASYAAALDHPDWFQNDPALGASNNIGIYATIHIPLIRALNQFTGDYGLAYAWLVLPQTFLQLLGFYILGRVLFTGTCGTGTGKNRFWAFLLAFLTAMTVINIGLGEIWGVWQDALPRVTFQSLLPFLLALTLVWKNHPRHWPWLMLFAGLLVYVHPISAPAWGLAIWLSLWFLQPKDWTWKRRAQVMLGLGALFLVVMTPFAINYMSFRGRDQALDYKTVMGILQAYSPANLLNVPAAVGDFLWKMTGSLLLPVALAGFAATWQLTKKDRTLVKIVLLWMAGIFITSVIIPFAEQVIEQHFQILPLETELVRCIRYFVPLLLLFWIWPLVEWTKRASNPQARLAAIALGVVLFGFWSATNRPAVRDIFQTFVCFTKTRLVCPAASPLNDLILTMRSQTQPGEGVLVFNEDTAFVSQSLSVRYAALRPLVYSLRDSGILGYSNRSVLLGWLATTKQMDTLRAMADPQERLIGLVPVANKLGASYLVVDFPVTPEMLEKLPISVIMRNSGFILLKLH